MSAYFVFVLEIEKSAVQPDHPRGAGAGGAAGPTSPGPKHDRTGEHADGDVDVQVRSYESVLVEVKIILVGQE